MNQNNRDKQKPRQVIITNYDDKQNKDIQKNKTYSTPKQIIANNAIKHIIWIAKQQIQKRNIIRKKLSKYGMKISENYIKQSIYLLLHKQQFLKVFKQEEESNPLRSDNLIPIGTNLEQKVPQAGQKKQTSPQVLTIRMARNSSIISLSGNRKNLPSQPNKKVPRVYQYVKLKQQDLPKIQTSFDPFIEQLRKQKDEQAILRQQQKRPSQKQRNSKLRELIKKDQKISYDFNGDIMKIKQSNQKGNFAGRSVNGNQNQQIIKDKLPKVDNNPIMLDNSISKKDLSKRNLSKRGLDVQFSNINTLTTELHINEGVKFLHNKATIQKKNKQPSLNQLKKTISNRRLSRNDFDRLKSLGDNKSIISKTQSPSLPNLQKSDIDIRQKSQSILGRSASQAKVNIKSLNQKKLYTNLYTQKSFDKISIQNQELTHVLFEPQYNSLQDKIKFFLPSQTPQETSKIQPLSAMDRANLNFIKTGSVGKVQLPKITYRISNQKVKQKNKSGYLPLPTLPQSKQKLKGKRKENEFQRVRKHFQDKLRT